MYCDKRLSSLFFSLFLSRERISLFFFHSFVSVISKNLCLVLSLKSSTTARFDENFFVFFAKSTKRGAKEEEKKDANARSHSHHHLTHRHIFSSLLASSHHQHQQKHTALLLHYHSFYATFCDFTQGERESVCV